jgi:hypothetical protein
MRTFKTFKQFLEAKARLDTGETPPEIMAKYGSPLYPQAQQPPPAQPQPPQAQPTPQEKELGQYYLRSMDIQAQRAAAARKQAARQNPPAV